MPREFTGPERVRFSGALLRAFPRWDELNALLLTLRKALGDIGGREAYFKDLVSRVVETAAAEGWEQELFDAAMAMNPGSPALQAFAGSMDNPPHSVAGARRGAQGVAAHAFMSKSSFNLHDQEAKWRRSFASSIEKRLLVFVLRDVDDDVFDQLTERVHRHLATMPPMLPQVVKVSLRPTLAAAQEAVDRLATWKGELATKHVLCAVHADMVDAHVIGEFFQSVRQQYPGALGRFLVIVVRVGADVALPADCVELPPPVFEEWHLIEWVNNVTQGREWPDEVITAFARWLQQLARYRDALTAGSVYDALTRAIVLLSENPSPERLMKRLEAGG